VFESGGPFVDLLDRPSREAKKDERLHSSGRLLKFRFNRVDWDLEPKTAFYGWLYLNALDRKDEMSVEICEFSAFSDIEFNPKKSINCQAYSAALYVSLSKRGILREALDSKESFLSILSESVISNAYENHEARPLLI
jgi:hypothetical protein